MHNEYSFTISQLIAWFLAICGGIVSVSAALSVLAKGVSKLKAPDVRQDKKLKEHDESLEEIHREIKMIKENRASIERLEKHQQEVDVMLAEHSRKMAEAEQHLEKIDHGNGVIMQALLALLSHGLDGNSIEPMRKAKAALEDYLING